MDVKEVVLVPDDKANELACPNLYALHTGLLKSAITYLFGVYVKEIL